MEFNYKGKVYSVGNVKNRMEHRELIKFQMEKIKDSLIFEDSGMTVFTKTEPEIELSRGCQACKNGSWWCLFVGKNCNMKCKFCSQDKSPESLNKWEHSKSIATYWIDDVKFYLDKFANKLTGISYTGGEPLMYLDKIIEIADYVQKSQKHIYQWIYSNGVLVDENNLKRLKEVGIEEMRVDLAATNFDDSVVNKLELIKNIIGKVTVEIPSVPETFQKLINEKYIHRLVDSGVEQLNLAEMDLRQSVNWETYALNEDIYIYDTYNSVIYSPVYSRQLTLLAMEYATKKGLNILINDCSNDAKHLQGIMREQNVPRATR